MDSQTPGTDRNRPNLPRGVGNKFIVCGGRDFHGRARVFAVLDAALAAYADDLMIVHGGARGADSIAGEWCSSRMVPCLIVPAQWEKHGKAAGAIRNREMLRWNVSGVIAFPGGRGTADMIAAARSAGVTVWLQEG